MLRHRALELVGAALVGLVLGWVAVLILADDGRRFPPAPVLTVGVGLLLGAVFVGVLLLAQRRRGAERETVRRALRTERLPDDVDDETMRRLLGKLSERLASARWWWPALAALQAALGVLRLVDVHTHPAARIGWGLDIVMWVGWAIGSLVVARRDGPTTRRLLAELDARAAVAGAQDRSASS